MGPKMCGQLGKQLKNIERERQNNWREEERVLAKVKKP